MLTLNFQLLIYEQWVELNTGISEKERETFGIDMMGARIVKKEAT